MKLRLTRRRSSAGLLALVLACAGLALVSTARAQTAPTLPPLPITTPSPTPTMKANPDACLPCTCSACPPTLPPANPPAVCCNQLPISSVGFVPIGADPATLANGGVILGPPLNPLHEPISASQALNIMSTCDPWAYAHLANGGLTHLILPFENDLSTDAWGFSVFPGTEWGKQRGGTIWSVWFVNANTGECQGVSYSNNLAASTQTSVGGVNPPQKPNPGDLEP